MSAWKTPPDLFAGLVAEDAAKRQRAFALVCLSRIIRLSPVDSGRYRGSHVLSVGKESYEVSSVPDRYGGVTLQAGEAKLRGIAKGAMPRIFIQTNLPYAQRLENGWSKQAPAGVYAVSFNYAVQVFR